MRRAATIALALCAACTKPTGALVHVDTDLGPEAFDRYLIHVEGEGTRAHFGPYLRAEVDPRPTFGLTPKDGDATRWAKVTVEAHLDQRPITTAEATLPSFAKNKIVDLYLFLTAPPSPPEDAGTSTTTTDAALEDAEPSDADPPDTGQDCPAPCTRCDVDGTCVIRCESDECNTGVTCPPGQPCRVNCIGDTACETGRIDCSAATRCDINCMGSDACDSGGILCAGEACAVVCQGEAACEEGRIECNATVCHIVCDGANACRGGVCCNSADCGASCTSVNGANCACL